MSKVYRGTSFVIKTRDKRVTLPYPASFSPIERNLLRNHDIAYETIQTVYRDGTAIITFYLNVLNGTCQGKRFRYDVVLSGDARI